MNLGLLLAPGAGAGRDQAALVAIDEAATQAGAIVERMDFPYRKAGRKAPDREPVLLEAVRAEVTGLTARSGRRLVLGGRSMGGRICSMVVAAGVDALGVPVGVDAAGVDAGGVGVVGLVLISYPLHPPGRPEKLRTAHFPDIRVPCLFVSGTRDAFGTPAELEAATAAIGAPVTHVWVDGKDHAMRNTEATVASVVVAWMESVG